MGSGSAVPSFLGGEGNFSAVFAVELGFLGAWTRLLLLLLLLLVLVMLEGLLCGGAWRLFFQLSFLLLVLRVKVMRLDNWRRGDRRRRKDSIIAREKARLLFILVSKALKSVLVGSESGQARKEK